MIAATMILHTLQSSTRITEEKTTPELNGGHSLGSARAEASGFIYFWVGGTNVLDYKYFTFMTTNTSVFDGMDFNAFVQSEVGMYIFIHNKTIQQSTSLSLGAPLNIF